MISVIITTCKREMSILKRAIDTVYAQTLRDIEIIVVNDYPEYDAQIRELLKKYRGVIYISHDKRQGACKSRNDGIMASTGDFVAFLDDDDEWENNKLEMQLKNIRKEESDFIYCGGIMLNDVNGKASEMSFIHDCIDGNYIKELLKGNFMGGCSFPLIKRSVLIALDGFDISMPSSQDYELWIRIAESYKIAYINEPLVIYNVGNEAITSNPERRIEGFCRLYKKHRDIYVEYPRESLIFYKTVIWTAIHTGRTDLIPYIRGIIQLRFPYHFLMSIYEIEERLKRRIRNLINGVWGE